MSSDLEALIEAVVFRIACAGEKGCSIGTLISWIRDLFDNATLSRQGDAGHLEESQNRATEELVEGAGSHSSVPTTVATAIIWKWVTSRQDVLVGKDREWNNVDLSELLRVFPAAEILNHASAKNGDLTGNDGQEQVPESKPLSASLPSSPRVFVSKEKLWECLAGHGVDFKRIPRLEWVALVGIASSMEDGILQSDLTSLVNQDKRSLPKRTGALAQKGYIEKRPILVRGLRTSKLWLKKFAPSEINTQPNLDNLSTSDAPGTPAHSPESIVRDMEPVSWCHRWLSDSVDYLDFSKTMISIVQSFGIIRYVDLKSKLGVLMFSRHSKLCAKTCRYFTRQGVLEHKAATTNSRVFKDCIKFIREPTLDEWNRYLSFSGGNSRGSTKEAAQDKPEGPATNKEISVKSRAEPGPMLERWTPDKPISTMVIDMIRRSGKSGLVNLAIASHSLGPSFNRYITSVTSAVSIKNLQPPHLQHFQVESEIFRRGRTAAYRFYIFDDKQLQQHDVVGQHEPASSASEGSSARPTHSSALKPPTEGIAMFGFGAPRNILETCVPVSSLEDIEGIPKVPESPQVEVKQIGSAPGSPILSSPARPMERSPSLDILDGGQIDEELQGGTSNGATTGQNAESVAPSVSVSGLVARDETAEHDVALQEEDTITVGEPLSTSPVKKKKKKGRPLNNASKLHYCEKCGGSWKNDLGLKYHLSKSRTSCNANYIPVKVPISPPKGTRPYNTSSSRSSLRGDGGTRRRGLRHLTSVSDEPEGTGVQKYSHSSDSDSDDDADLEQNIPTTVAVGGVIDVRNSHMRAVVYDKSVSKRNATSGKMDTHSSATTSLPAPVLPDTGPVPADSEVSNNVERDASSQQNLDSQPAKTRSVEYKPIDNAPVPAGDLNIPALFRMPPEVELPGLSDAARKRLRCNEIIKFLLKVHGRMFPARKSLWHSLAAVWNAAFPDDPAPNFKISQQAVRALIKEGIVLEASYSFARPAGGFDQFFLLIETDVDPHSPALDDMKAKIKACHPIPYIPDNILDNDTRRGISDIGVLDAPFYIASSAKKRKPLFGLQEEDISYEPSPSRKRGRRSRYDLEDWEGHLSHGRNILSYGDSSTGKNDYRPPGGTEDETEIGPYTQDSDYGRDQQDALDARTSEDRNSQPLGSSNGDNHKRYADSRGPLAEEFESANRVSGPARLTPTTSSEFNPYPSLSRGVAEKKNGMQPPSAAMQHRGRARGSRMLSRVSRSMMTERVLTRIPDEDSSTVDGAKEVADQQWEGSIDDAITAAFVAVRSILGGLDKTIDWGLLLHIFPGTSLNRLRRIWVKLQKEKKDFLSSFTETFQTAFIEAYEKQEVPSVDFHDPPASDWVGIINWAIRLQGSSFVRLPTSRARLDETYEIQESKNPNPPRNWQDVYYHQQSSVLSRFELTAAIPAVLDVPSSLAKSPTTQPPDTRTVLKSWMRCLCSSEGRSFSSEEIETKFLSLVDGDSTKLNTHLEVVVAELGSERVIRRGKCSIVGSQPFQLNKYFKTILQKTSQESKYRDAQLFKTELDEVFRKGKAFPLPTTVSDGAVMALMDLCAYGRTKITGQGIPNIPLGFEPGSYESRKISKSLLNFDILITPTDSYLFNEDIKILKDASEAGPATNAPGSLLPIWCDLDGTPDHDRWSTALGAVMFMIGIRGPMTGETVAKLLRPTLLGFEAQMILEWAEAVGLMRRSTEGGGFTLAEWWWLAVTKNSAQ